MKAQRTLHPKRRENPAFLWPQIKATSGVSQTCVCGRPASFWRVWCSVALSLSGESRVPEGGYFTTSSREARQSHPEKSLETRELGRPAPPPPLIGPSGDRARPRSARTALSLAPHALPQRVLGTRAAGRGGRLRGSRLRAGTRGTTVPRQDTAGRRNAQ